MSPRTRFAVILGLTVFAVFAALGYAAGRARHWDRHGWTGVNFLAGFNAAQQAKVLGMVEGQVVTTVAGSPADGKLLYGDQILTINGIPLKEPRRLRALDASVKSGDTVVYRLERGKRQLEVPIRLGSPWTSRMVVAYHVVGIVVALIFIAIGLLIIARAPGDNRATVFYILSLLTSVALIGRAATIYEQSNCRGIVMDPAQIFVSAMTFGVLGLMFLPMVLHLALIFPRRRPIVERHPYVLRWVYAGAFLAIVALLFFVGTAVVVSSDDFEKADKRLEAMLEPLGYALLAGSALVAAQLLYAGRREGIRNAILDRPFRVSVAMIGLFGAVSRLAGSVGLKIISVIFVFGAMFLPFAIILSFPLFAVAALYRSYRAANLEEKRQVAWPLWGLLTAVAGKILGFILTSGIAGWVAFTHRDMIAWRGVMEALVYIPTILTLLIPISFAVAILKYRLMNIDVIIRKTIVYTVLSGFIIVVYLGLVGVLGAVLVNVFGVRDQATIIGATLVVALVFVPMRNKLQTVVERNLFRHRFEYPEALRAISMDALAATELERFLAAAAEKTQQALQNRAVVIFTPRHDDFVATAKIGVADTLVGTLRVPGPQILPLLNAPFDPRNHEAAAPLRRIEATLVVPINSPGTPANGFLAVAPKLSGGPFEPEDVEFLRSVASQLDVGIDRIRQQREDADYSQARTIQQGLLPREMPQLAGLDLAGMWQPARTMGGDYYDLLALSDTELAVCIGDVAGKGMPAALLMSGLQAAVRASASSSPRDLCERVRRVVVSSLSGGRFVTFFYATIDTAAMRLRWTNAGHNAPVLARADGSVVRLEEGGPAISRLFRDTKYEEREIAIGPGDRLVLFTDGLSEASDGTDLFGEERIVAIASAAGNTGAAELQQRIVGEAMSFAEGEIEDDLTLVVVAITPS
ncbi:MAG TPA: SpoIIE family protein phosphatase [Thermoanaerobaculia bacterium]|nr:SpoIIE family protein phosphatase [Thermoanaerobaculia bacterium]